MRPMKRAGSRFLGGGRLPVPVPALGAELVVNGDMETGDPPTGWSALNGATLAASTDVHPSGGTHSLLLTRGSSADSTGKTLTQSAGTWIAFGSWIKNGTATNGNMRLFSGSAYNASPAVTAATWTYVRGVQRAAGANPLLHLLVTGAVGTTALFDDVSAKVITLASMFSTRPYSTHRTTKAMASIVAGTRAGVVANLDSATSPANFVIASHDGTTARLTKCVAGTYTELISQAVAYVAGAYVEIRRPAAGNNWQLFYNGSQVGTDQAIADAAIQAATLHGLFNTYSGNVLAGFSCVPS